MPVDGARSPKRRSRRSRWALTTPVLLTVTVAVAAGLNWAVVTLDDDTGQVVAAPPDASALPVAAEGDPTAALPNADGAVPQEIQREIVVEVDVTIPLAAVSAAPGADASGGDYDFSGYEFVGVAPTIVVARHSMELAPRLELWSVETEVGWTYSTRRVSAMEIEVEFVRGRDGQAATFTARLEGDTIVVGRSRR